MKKFTKVIAVTSLGLCAVVLSGCSSTGMNPLGLIGAPSDSSIVTNTHHYNPTKKEDVKIILDSQPSKAYTTIGQVSVDETSYFMSRSLESKYNIMKEKSAKMGGDAVMNIHSSMATMDGTVIKFKS